MQNLNTTSLTDNLNSIQREAVMNTEGPQLILAGAGSGKTRVLTYKIAWLIRQAPDLHSRILAVTFTNKAAREMKKRVAELLDCPMDLKWLGTFHAICARILRIHGKYLGFDANFTIYDKDDQKKFLKKLLGDECEQYLKPEILTSKINYYKNADISPDQVLKDALSQEEERLGIYFRTYQAALLKNNAMDFGDLICNTIKLLRENEDVRKIYNNRWKYILIDEFQDTNKSQFELIKILMGDNLNITVVGDEDQSIYGWRGADINNILSFEKFFPNSRVIKMEENYRSSANIIGLASSVICRNTQRLGKKIWTARDPGEKVNLHRFMDENDEAEKVVDDINSNRQFGLNQTAVFYRTNAQSRVFEDYLRRKNLPYVIFGGTRFYDRKEVKDILAYLRVIVNTKDSISLGRVVNVPKRGIGDKTVNCFADLALKENVSLFEAMKHCCSDENHDIQTRKIFPFMELILSLQEYARESSASEVVEKVIEQTGYREFLEKGDGEDSQDRLNNIAELVSAAEDFENRNPDKGLDEFLQEISLMTQADEGDNSSGAVTLMTIHSAKGLEFPNVYITGLEDGLFPLLRDGNTEFLEEERRLFYVAVTRAREKLSISYAGSRRKWGYANITEPSRFIYEADSRFLNKKSLRSPKKPEKSETGLTYVPVEDCDFPDYEGLQDNTLKEGQKIHHQTFGEGKIRKVEGRGDSSRITVFFEDGVNRKLMPKYAKITLLG